MLGETPLIPVKGTTMDADWRVVPTAESQPDYFTLALLLAEGQTGDIEEHWSTFIDNLARITDAFARARSPISTFARAEEVVSA